MAKRFSTGLANALAASMSLAQALGNGKLLIYQGSQPTTANDTVSGSTLLAAFTLGGGNYTTETLSFCTLTVSSSDVWSTGALNSIKYGGVDLISGGVPTGNDAPTTAAAIAAMINSSFNLADFSATASGAVVTIRAAKTSGARYNGASLTLAWTGGLSGNSASLSLAGGVNGINGLNFQFPPVNGTISKEIAAWQATAAATGTAQWFRFIGNGEDDGSIDTIGKYMRFDGSVGTSGADMIVSSVAITQGAVQTVNSFQLTIPTVQG